MDWNPVFLSLLLVTGAMLLLAEFGPGKKTAGGSATPVIQSATCRRDGVLELRVAASHPKIVEDLDLPEGTWISDIQRNRLYLAECPLSLQGNEMSDADVYDRAVELAQALGWSGKVKKG